MKSLVSYINTLYARNEINDQIKEKIKPRAAHVSRAHATPKTHKPFVQLPKFRPIIDTIGSPYYGVGKYLTTLLNPLTLNDYVVKDSFEAAEKIRQIPPELFNQGYTFISFDVESLFTNVPLKKTVDVIIDRVYKDKLIETNLTKRSLKKLILDACQKTTFSFNSKLYEQVEGVSMGASLGPVLANIILTELEKKIVQPLIAENCVKFYIRYVDDTLLLIKHENIDRVLSLLNSFHPNLRFTVDHFPDNNVHFLDLSIDKNSTDIFYKDTHTGQYTHFTAFTPWKFKIAWIKSLFHRATKICSDENLLKGQLSKLTKFISWNGFPIYIGKSLINRLKKDEKVDQNDLDPDIPTIWLTIPYAGDTGEYLVKSCIRKIRKFMKDVKVIVRYTTKNISLFCSTKDPIPIEQRAQVIYEITCPGCGGKYIGKTDRCISIRMTEQGSRTDQPMHRHLSTCEKFKDLIILFALPDVDSNTSIVNMGNHILNAVLNNYVIIDYNSYRFNWSQLLYLEAFYIKTRKPIINHGLKASKEFVLFA